MTSLREASFALALYIWPTAELVALQKDLLRIGRINSKNICFDRARQTVQVNEIGEVTDPKGVVDSAELESLKKACIMEMTQRGLIPVATSTRH